MVGYRTKNLFWNTRLSANWMRKIMSRKIQGIFCTSCLPGNRDVFVCFPLNFPLFKFSIQKFKKSGISKLFFLFLTLSYITLSLTFCSFMPAMPTTRIFNWVLRCSFMYIAAAEILRVCRCISMFEIVWFRKYVCKHDPLFIQRGTTD